ncbi:uncharacterized protein LOC143894887 [Temnothorax americanus]|uniref:uncharacterized protein LOC143894887 n=1 Tax=Temnothorax americanus TaxID=1964332 RepID=UPI004069047C
MENIAINSKKKESYKWCFVPKCTNTSIKTPNKIFLTMPRDIKHRKTWMKMARRDDVADPPTSCLFCCEDHFNLQEDIDNYCRFKIMGGRIQLKKDTVPHIFDCQKDRQNTSDKADMRPGAAKRKRIQILQDMEKEVSEKTVADEIDAGCFSQTVMDTTDDALIQENMDIDERNNLEIRFIDVGIQAKPHFRSKAILCKPISKDMACSPIKQYINAEKSSIDKSSSNITNDTIDNITSISEDTLKSTDEYFPSEEYTSEELKTHKTESDDITKKLKLSIIKKKPKMYIGIPEQFLYVIDFLHNKTDLPASQVPLNHQKQK